MNLDQIEERLRQPHPLERSYATYRNRQRRPLVTQRSSLAGLGGTLVPIAVLVAALAIFVRVSNSNSPGALPQASSPVTGLSPEPTKPYLSMDTGTPAPAPSVSAPCAAGAVKATLIGWGGAGGTQYALVRLEPVAGSCSLPQTPALEITNGTGSTIATSAAGAPGERVELSSTFEARVGITSLCPASAEKLLNVVLELGPANRVSVPLPAQFTVPCTGPASSMFLDDLFPAP